MYEIFWFSYIRKAENLFFSPLLAFAVAMFRNFSTCHPIFKLLKENEKFIIAVETRGREVCFAPVGDGHLSLTTGLSSTGNIEFLTKALQRHDLQRLPLYQPYEEERHDDPNTNGSLFDEHAVEHINEQFVKSP